jgi:RNA polymerase sigma-70 factor (ECF subfamily)
LPHSDAATAVSAAYRDEWSSIVATLIRMTGDWDLAEEAAGAAFEKAVKRWPDEGIPTSPGGWLTTVARNHALDVLRRRTSERSKYREVAIMQQLEGEGSEPDAGLLGIDDRLRLIFTCAHPALPLEARVALTLRTVAGLTTSEIARAFLVPEATMAQRLVRAKGKIRNAGIPYRTPEGDALPARLHGVLAVLYLVYNEGYAPSSGDEVVRVDLADEAIRLTRLLVRLMPAEPETRALLALMLLQHARRAARTLDGELVSLEAQDRSRWDAGEIAEGLELLSDPAGRGPYRIQAELQAVHATAGTADGTDWPRIVTLYDELLRYSDSPFVALNRAIARGFAEGPDVGLAGLDALAATGRLDGYHLLPAAQAEFLALRGDAAAAVARYREAIALAPTGPEQRHLERKMRGISPPGA